MGRILRDTIVSDISLNILLDKYLAEPLQLNRIFSPFLLFLLCRRHIVFILSFHVILKFVCVWKLENFCHSLLF